MNLLKDIFLALIIVPFFYMSIVWLGVARLINLPAERAAAKKRDEMKKKYVDYKVPTHEGESIETEAFRKSFGDGK